RINPRENFLTFLLHCFGEITQIKFAKNITFEKLTLIYFRKMQLLQKSKVNFSCLFMTFFISSKEISFLSFSLTSFVKALRTSSKSSLSSLLTYW
ncbi:hypothetical protein, partial [uncultured Succinatimonas sp.]|uniref:hypothetical protein n=1 Tax=uncultured Succinatimonas sp. TaxID=1262973 RepID=UPI0025EC7520